MSKGPPDSDSDFYIHFDAQEEYEELETKVTDHFRSLAGQSAARQQANPEIVYLEHLREAAEVLLNTTLSAKPSKCLFISYSHQDRDTLQDLLHALDASGITYFLAERDIELGESWYKRIIQEIADCRIFLSFITPSFLQSEWRLLEAGVALASEKEFCQILYHSDPDRLEDSLRSFQTKTVKNNSDLTSVVRFLESKCNTSPDA